MSGKFIVFDTHSPHFRNNRFLDLRHAEKFPELDAITPLSRMARDNGWQIVSGDFFVATKPTFKRAVCISREAQSPEFMTLLRMGVEPRLLFTGESPNVSWSFYHNVGRLSRRFSHVSLFRGIRNRIPGHVEFHHHYWPMPKKASDVFKSFGERKLLVMVASFKERFTQNRQNVLSRLYSPWRWTKILYYRCIDQYARFEDLYDERLNAIKEYSNFPGFHLFGRNWDVARRYVSDIKKLSFANLPETVGDKIAAMGGFKFALVFENCIFPGYLTEKIFDAMLAGCVPVYYGAPDVEDFVPRECFIDYRNYGGFKNLWDDLSSWSEDRWLKKIAHIKKFLNSLQYQPFCAEVVAASYYDWLTED